MPAIDARFLLGSGAESTLVKLGDMEDRVCLALSSAVTHKQEAASWVLIHTGQLHGNGSIDNCAGAPAEDIASFEGLLVRRREMIDAQWSVVAS